MRSRLVFGVIVAVLVGGCLAAVAEAYPKQCLCKVSCYLVCATPDKAAQPFVVGN